MSADPTWRALPVRATEQPSAAARAAAIARLEAWAIEHDARFDALELGVDAAGDSTVRARRPLVAGEAIVTIPRALILSDADLAATATGEPDPYGGAQRNPRDTMAAWLALEVGRADSPWRPFLEVLPVAFPDVPVFRGGDDLAPLAGTAARLWAAETREDIVATHAAFTASLRARVSLAAYAWGRAVVRSRGFNAPFTLDPRLAFIPIIDLMDHRRDETAWEYVPRRGEYVLRTLRDFAVGERVHFTYGSYGNAHLLVEYGFALPDNPYDEAVLFLGGEPVLVRAGANDQLSHALSLATPAELAAEARRRLTEIDAAAAGPTAGAWDTTCALVRRGERRALEALLAMVATS